MSPHELLSLSVTPIIAAGLSWALLSLTGGSGLLAPTFVVLLLLIPGYLILLFLALPLYVWTKQKFGISWLTVLAAGALCGAFIPTAIHGVLLMDATLGGRTDSLLSIMKDGVVATALGVAIGLVAAAIFKLLVGRAPQV